MNNQGGSHSPRSKKGDRTMSLLQVLQEELGLTIDEAKAVIKELNEQ